MGTVLSHGPPHERATSCWYRVAALVSRDQKEFPPRYGMHQTLLEAAKLVLSGDPIEIARLLRDRAERTIRPPTSKS